MDYLSKDNYTKNIPEQIIFFTFAEGGAMGRPGSIELITKDSEHYIAYYLPYSSKRIEYNDIQKLFPPFRDIRFETFGGCQGFLDNWKYVSLGCGNHLFVRSEVYSEFEELTADCEIPSQIYSKWIDVALAILSKQT